MNEFEQRIAQSLPPGERLLGFFGVSRTLSYSVEGKGDVPANRRPYVLTDAPKRGWWDRSVSQFFKVILNQDPNPGADRPGKAVMDPAKRGKLQKRRALYYGGWDSLAGQWLAAAQPRSQAKVSVFVAVTERHLRFVYTEIRRDSRKLDGALEAGAVFPRQSVVWTRRADGGGRDLQFGFGDGSWGTLFVGDVEGIAAYFPGALSHDDPIP